MPFQQKFPILNHHIKRLSISSNCLLIFAFILSLFATVVSSTVIDYDEMSRGLKEQQMIHTSNKFISDSKPCLEVSDQNVTFIKAISKKAQKLVTVSPLIKYNVAYCTPESEANTECAPASRCTTVYKWKPAMTQIDANILTKDEILVPTGCMCFLGSDSAEQNSDESPLGKKAGEKKSHEDGIDYLVIDCSGFTFIDYTSISALADIFKRLKRSGISVSFAEAKAPIRDTLECCGFYDTVPKCNFFPTIIHDLSEFFVEMEIYIF